MQKKIVFNSFIYLTHKLLKCVIILNHIQISQEFMEQPVSPQPTSIMQTLLTPSVILFVLAGLFLLIFIFKTFTNKSNSNQAKIQEENVEIQKKDYGRILIFYGSQTGTAAKMAEGFAEQAQENGFKGQVIGLENLSIEHFKKNEISVFFLSNTGQGDPPDNTVLFMKMLNTKNAEKLQLGQKLQGFHQKLWTNMSYTIFGLGNTQYQHYNKIGIDADKFLFEKNAQRIYKLGLGDNNASLQDDYIEWKQGLWPKLQQFRDSHPIKQQQDSHEQHHVQRRPSNMSTKSDNQRRKSITIEQPIIANWKFFVLNKPQVQLQATQQLLNFKARAALKAQKCTVQSIIQKRQNTNDGSSLQLVIKFPQEKKYETACNLALWPQNNPKLIEQVAQYFKLNLDQLVGIQILNDKKISMNFKWPCTLRNLLTCQIDLQSKITKAILKKLGKFQSENKQYFIDNSSPKTTEQYKKLSQADFIYPFMLIKKYQVQITFEDFIEISDAVAPRLFTVASSFRKHKDAVIIASLVENGLISNHFSRNPTQFYGQFRKSTFTDAMQWEKVIFISAGTGLAPFIGFMQDKEKLIEQKQKVPIVTMFFGCKHENGDFIYKQDILGWKEKNLIQKLHLAFSRDHEKKVYVQHLLKQQKQQLHQYIKDDKCAMYLCGSFSMGNDVQHCLIQFITSQMGETEAKAKQIIVDLQKNKRFVKQLW